MVATPRLAKISELRVTCPYCQVGHATVIVEHKHGADELQGGRDPRKCSACGRYFLIAIRLHVYGKPLPEPQPAPSSGQILRNLLGNQV